jgi:hypothetical protein
MVTISSGVVKSVIEKYDPSKSKSEFVKMQEARINSLAVNLSTLEGVCSEIKGLGEKSA